MQDRFEKEVQEKMEELKLSPSAPVWEKIELEIRPERKRRRVIVWMFCGLLLIGGGLLSYELFKPSEIAKTQPNIPSTTSHSKRTNSNPDSPTSSASITGKANTSNSIQSGLATKKLQTTKEDEIVIDAETKSPAIAKKLSKKVSVPAEKFERNERLTKSSVVVPNAITVDQLLVQKEQKKAPSTESKTDQSSQEVATKVDSVHTNALTSTKDSIATTELKEQPIRVADSVSKKKIANSSRWNKRINLAVGRSGYVSGSFLTALGINDSYSSAANQSNYGGGQGTAAGVIAPPSSTENGPAFSIGTSLCKNLNTHFELAVGLQYSQYSTYMQVGAGSNNDTVLRSSTGSFTVGQYYTNTNRVNQYTNRFHVIEVPVTLSYKPVLKVPVLLSVGIAYGYLLSTNALSYSRTANVFYPDKESYVRHSMPLLASLEADLFQKKKVALRIGPAIQYNLIKLRKEATINPQHLFFAGVKTAIIF